MRTIREAHLLQRARRTWTAEGKSVALVPTMGALHPGHRQLIEEAKKRAEIVVVSIYVNPTQFGPREDLVQYPRPFEEDQKLCREAGVSVLFHPENLYTPDHSTWVVEECIAQGRCEVSRPGHFRGVATVVVKLFNLVQPEIAVFGWKDAQQVELIQRVVRDLNLSVQIHPVETVRDADGLAVSSRNRYLSPKEREQALALPCLLLAATAQANPVQWLETSLRRCPGIKVDYVELAQGRLCAAIRVGRTRLLDNIKVS